jgi:hypothetical protein
MTILRWLISLAAIAAGVAFAFHTARGLDPRDERPLAHAVMPQNQLGRYVFRGFPWQDRRPQLLALATDLPPDPDDPTAEDLRKDVERIVQRASIKFPSGRMTWPEILEALKAAFAEQGIVVMSEPQSLPDAYALDVPANEWTGFSLLYELYLHSDKRFAWAATSEGIVVGSNDTVNAKVRMTKLEECRRRVASEHADPIFDAPYRPDMQDSPIAAVAAGMKAQTGIDVEVCVALWEKGTILAWRGEPRPLRSALDDICKQLRAYWRYRDGRVSILVVP